MASAAGFSGDRRRRRDHGLETKVSRALFLLSFVASTTATVACRTPTSLGNPDADVHIVIDPAKRFQTIAGWGASMRLFSDPHIIGLPQEDPANALQIPVSAQNEILDSLYRALGLTRVRVATETADIEPVNDNQDPAHTNLSAFDFSARKNDAFFDVVRDLRARGVTSWWMSPIGAAAWMADASPAEYVELAMAINRRWRDNGLELPYYSIANEPTGQGAPFNNGDYLRQAVILLGRALASEGFKTKLVIPDDINPSSAASLARSILVDPEARQYVGAISFHLYGEPLGASAEVAAVSAQYGIPLWMSEFYVPDRIQWAAIVHSLLSDYNATAVDYLAGFLGDSPDDPSLIKLLHTGTEYSGYKMSGEYYSFGNFSRFVRPGAVRIDATSSSHAVLVSAFITNGKLTIVATNQEESDVTARMDLSASASNQTFSAVRTSDHEGLAALPPLNLAGGTLAIVLKGRSVTTLYQ
jgi:glucuronoarabinoxylan endo-1,4-beta-xylanase